jgi:hypothetical protein
LIFEHSFTRHTRDHRSRASAGHKIVHHRPLNEILKGIASDFFLADRHAELAKAKLKFVDAMDVYVEVA